VTRSCRHHSPPYGSCAASHRTALCPQRNRLRPSQHLFFNPLGVLIQGRCSRLGGGEQIVLDLGAASASMGTKPANKSDPLAVDSAPSPPTLAHLLGNHKGARLGDTRGVSRSRLSVMPSGARATGQSPDDQRIHAFNASSQPLAGSAANRAPSKLRMVDLVTWSMIVQSSGHPPTIGLYRSWQPGQPPPNRRRLVRNGLGA